MKFHAAIKVSDDEIIFSVDWFRTNVDRVTGPDRVVQRASVVHVSHRKLREYVHPPRKYHLPQMRYEYSFQLGTT